MPSEDGEHRANAAPSLSIPRPSKLGTVPPPRANGTVGATLPPPSPLPSRPPPRRSGTMAVRPPVVPRNVHEEDLLEAEEDDDAPTLEFSMSKFAVSLLMHAAEPSADQMRVDATPAPPEAATPEVTAAPPADPSPITESLLSTVTESLSPPIAESLVSPIEIEDATSESEDDDFEVPFLPNNRRRLAIALFAVFVVLSIVFAVGFR